MKIALASDHAGFLLKEALRAHLEDRAHTVIDCGTHSEERSDYPDYAKVAARTVATGDAERAFLVCGSGIGMCIVANRFKGVRAVVLHDRYDAEMSRMHNDANVACLGSRATSLAAAIELVDVFLATAFEGGRHEDRVKKIDE